MKSTGNAFDKPTGKPLFSRAEIAAQQKPKNHTQPRNSAFNVAIASRADSERTARIRGRG